MCIVEFKKKYKLLTTCYRTGEYFLNTVLTDNVLRFLRDEGNVLDVQEVASCMTRRHVSTLWQHKSCYGKVASTSSTTASAGLISRLESGRGSGSDHQGSCRRSHVEWRRARAIFTPLFLQTVLHDLEHDTILICFFYNFELLLSFRHRLDAVVAAAGGQMDY